MASEIFLAEVFGQLLMDVENIAAVLGGVALVHRRTELDDGPVLKEQAQGASLLGRERGIRGAIAHQPGQLIFSIHGFNPQASANGELRNDRGERPPISGS